MAKTFRTWHPARGGLEQRICDSCKRVKPDMREVEGRILCEDCRRRKR